MLKEDNVVFFGLNALRDPCNGGGGGGGRTRANFFLWSVRKTPKYRH